MPKRKKIEELEIAVLLSLYSKVKYSKHAHPKTFIAYIFSESDSFGYYLSYSVGLTHRAIQ